MLPPLLLLRPEDTAVVLGIGRTKVYELMRSYALRSVKVGGLRRIPATALDEFVAQGEENTSGTTVARAKGRTLTALAAWAEPSRSVRPGPTSLAGPPWAALHGGELQPNCNPAMSVKGAGRQDTRPFTGRDRWSGTAAPRQPALPHALPTSAVSARGPDGAHAIG